VHRDDQIRLDQTDDLRRLGCIQPSPATHRDQHHIDRAQRFDLRLGGRLFEIAQMRHGDAIIIEHIDRIAGSAVLAFLPARLPLSDWTPVMNTPPISNSPGPSMTCEVALDRIRIVVTGRVVADRDDIRLELQCIVADGFVIEWIRHHCGVVTLRETKTGMSVPGNFHP
jgi:hypothetical protein